MTASPARREPSDEPHTQRVWCRAAHPAAALAYKPEGTECANLLGDIPAGYHFVKTVPVRPPQNGDGRIWVQCSRSSCKAWNVFERVTDGE